ncbi:cytochrome P450 [Dichotomopilus funicola]|uniref:Cytochrome P450 n=1 Tax=Dichotomopilus funicola TaxID=1934379 RepID=A0AAN6ZLV7_9PEZI|nr:cytochrome P450 [Dichotomopilus funicola]
MIPYRLITAVALGGAYLLSSGRIPQWTPFGFLPTFVALWAVQSLAYAFWAVILYPKFFSPLRGLPEPSGNSWFMGQFGKIRASPTGVPMLEWINSVPNDGLIRYLSLFNQEKLFMTSPKALAEVLVTKSYDFVRPGPVRFVLGRILGDSLLIAEGDVHKMQRRNLLPAFAFRHIKDLYPVFWTKAREGVQAMTEEILKGAALNGQPGGRSGVIEASSWASRITLDIIGVAGLGRDFNAIKDPGNPLTEAYARLFKPSRQARTLQLLGLITHPRLVALLPVKRNGDIDASAHHIRAVCANIIQEKKQKLAEKERTDVDILSLMTFLAAGHETTASSMTWAIYLLAKHPEVQRRLRAEVREHLPPPSGADDAASSISSVDIDKMPYLNAVCNEVLRYYGPVPLTPRVAARDTTILGQRVPKGTQVVLVPWAINKSEAMWGADALVFNPDRWMPGPDDADRRAAASGGATSNYAFMTFLHGPRSCIGMSFAKAEFACLLASWIGRFEVELHNKEELDESRIEIKGGVTARPAHGMYVKATVVEGW